MPLDSAVGFSPALQLCRPYRAKTTGKALGLIFPPPAWGSGLLPLVKDPRPLRGDARTNMSEVLS